MEGEGGRKSRWRTSRRSGLRREGECGRGADPTVTTPERQQERSGLGDLIFRAEQFLSSDLNKVAVG